MHTPEYKIEYIYKIILIMERGGGITTDQLLPLWLINSVKPVQQADF